MRCIDVKQFKENVKPDAESATFTDSSGIESTVSFGYQKTGYGLKRFFLCPCCAKRVQKLYQVDYSYKCRDCAGINPYRGITNMTKGGADEIAYRMIRYAEKNDIQFNFPFDYLQYVYDKRIKKQSFRKCLAVLQGLENMRFQAILNKTTYSAKILSSVCRGKHPLLCEKSLSDLKNWFYDWNTGKEIVLQHPKQMIK